MEDTYLVPEYYPDFSCKMGSCRRPCCEGWPISVSMRDYFTLLGADCSPELRRKLDCALHLSLHPTEDAYAQILPRYDGQCPLHMEDGLCAIHAECGEALLAAVCRLYPRGIRSGTDSECSCANSCERVVELLLEREAPLTFRRITQDFDLPDALRTNPLLHTVKCEQAIRLRLISLLQNREYPLPQRILLLGQALQAIAPSLAAKDDAQLQACLQGHLPISTPEFPAPSCEQRLAGFRIAEQLLTVLNRDSISLCEYIRRALACFGSGSSTYTRFQTAASHLSAVLPQWQTWMEHLLVNHMYFVQFPFQDRSHPLQDEYLSLCAVYTLLRCLLVGCMAECDDESHAVDIAAAVFRLVEHTEFDRFAAPLLRDLGCHQWNDVQLILTF